MLFIQKNTFCDIFLLYIYNHTLILTKTLYPSKAQLLIKYRLSTSYPPDKNIFHKQITKKN